MTWPATSAIAVSAISISTAAVGGESFPANTMTAVIWTATDNQGIAYVEIDFSEDGGAARRVALFFMHALSANLPVPEVEDAQATTVVKPAGDLDHETMTALRDLTKTFRDDLQTTFHAAGRATVSIARPSCPGSATPSYR